MKNQPPNIEQSTPDSISDRRYREVSEAEIAMRAYSIYQSRGCQDGADLDDWLQAERELNEQPSVARGVSARGAA